MKEWDAAARDALAAYLERVRSLCADRGPDESAELMDNLREYVTREAEGAGGEPVSEAAVQLAIGRAGTPESVAGFGGGEAEEGGLGQEGPESAAQVLPVKKRFGAVISEEKAERSAMAGPVLRMAGGGLVWGFCILIPALAILVEAATHMCAEIYGDPLPSWWHFLGLLPVPVVIALTAHSLHRAVLPQTLRWYYLGNGYLFAVSLGYAVAFVPLLPVAVPGILILGFGLLPLSPYFTLIASIQQGRNLRMRRSEFSEHTGFWRWWLGGLAAAFLFFGVWEGRYYLSQRGMEQALSSDPQTRDDGVKTLRLLRAEEFVLRSCYGKSRVGGGFWGEGLTTDRKAYQVLYFRLTGRDYRQEAEPAGTKNFMWTRDSGREEQSRETWTDVMLADQEVGSSEAGTLSRQLSLQSSAVDVSVAAAPDEITAGPCVAYAEVTFEFYNNSTRDKEARCQMILPPGGVASRLTLWIDGEEREAAFGRRSTVQEAYRQVAVVRRRDPALLTTAGPDRVLLQCFPVRPMVPMKVKVGFTLPLLPDNGRAILQLPYIAERNFMIGSQLRHKIWVESRCPLDANTMALQNERSRAALKPFTGPEEAALLRAKNGGAVASGDLFSVRGDLKQEELPEVMLSAKLPAAGERYQAELDGLKASAEVRPEQPLAKRQVAIVLDTSASCADFLRQTGPLPAGEKGIGLDWESLLKQVPEQVRVAVFAGEAVTQGLSREEAVWQVSALLREVKFAGADEQVRTLEKAWDFCAQEPDGLILWLHGALPVELADCAGLEQRLRRRPGFPGNGNPRILSVQLLPGPNRIEEKLGGVAGLFRLPLPAGNGRQEQMGRLLAQLAYPSTTKNDVVYRLAESDVAKSATPAGSGHLVRLAYAQELVRQMQQKQPNRPLAEDLIKTACRLRLVTPATGAVVLENKRQYEQNDLDPDADAKNVPTIPEPEEWALLLTALLALLLLVWRRRVKERRMKSGVL